MRGEEAPADERAEATPGGPATAEYATRRTRSPRLRLIWGLRLLVGVGVVTFGGTWIGTAVALLPVWSGAAVGFLVAVAGLAEQSPATASPSVTSVLSRRARARAMSDTGPGSDDAVGEMGEATANAPATVDPTTDRRTISPRIRIIWGLRVLGGIAALSAVLIVVGARVSAVPVWAGPVVGLVLAVLGLVWIEARYRVWAFEVREDALYLERGVLTHVRTIAPYVRIQHVDTQRGPLERWLGLSTLVVYTAGSRGADVSIPGLTPEEAETLQARVKALAIAAEGGDAV